MSKKKKKFQYSYKYVDFLNDLIGIKSGVIRELKKEVVNLRNLLIRR